MTSPAQTKYNSQTDPLKGLSKEGYINVTEAANLIGISPTSLRRLEENGKIKSIREGNGYRLFKTEEVINLKLDLEKEKATKKDIKKLTQTSVQVQIIDTKNEDKVITKPIIKHTPRFINYIRNAETFIKGIKNNINLDVFKVKMVPEFVILGTIALASITLVTQANKFNFENAVKGTFKTNTKSAANATTTTNNNVLAAKDRITNFVYNINVPTNIKNKLTVEGDLVTPGITFEGAGIISGLQDVDAASKATLERILSLNGDVTGTVTNSKIADGAIKGNNLAGDITYDGTWDFANGFSINGANLTATADQLNNLADNEADLIDLASNVNPLTNLANEETPLTNLAGYETQLVILASSQPQITAGNAFETTLGGLAFGDGSSYIQDLPNLFWDDTNNRLGIGTSTPGYTLDINGTSRFTDNLIFSGTSISLTGNISVFEQKTAAGNIELRTGNEGEIKLVAGLNGLIQLSPSNEYVYVEGNGLKVDESFNTLNVSSLAHIVQIGTDTYGSNLLNVGGNVGIGTNLYFNNTSGGVDGDSSYGLRANSGILEFKNQSGVWTEILGAGGISPAGSNGAVQFTDGSSFQADTSNFRWNDSLNYLTISSLRSIGPTNPLTITDANGNGGLAIGLNGNVGIANTNPTAALDIIGNAKLSGDLFIASVGLGSTANPSGATKVGIQYGSLTNAPLAKNVQEALAAIDGIVGASAGDIKAIGSITSGEAFNSIATADGQWLGLGASSGRLAFTTAPGNPQIQLLGGNVGIGTTNASSLLDVAGTISGNKFAFRDNSTNYFEYINDGIGLATNNSTRISISNNGQVGIGTTAPDAALTVIPSGSGIAVSIKDSGELRMYSSDGSYLGFKAPNSAPGNQIYVLPASDGLNNQVLTTDGTGNLTWKTASGVGSSATGDIESVGSITSGNAFSDASADGQWLGLGAAAGRIYFSDDTTDEISFLSANIGIGKTNPTSALDVNGTVTATSLTDGTAILTSGNLTALSVGATNINVFGTVDLGANTIYDGFLTGNWNFSNGAITSLSNVATTNATISGTLSGNIINGNTATISNIYAALISSTNMTITGTLTGTTANLATIGSTNITSTGIITGSTANLATIGTTNITSTGLITGNSASISSIGTTSFTASGTVNLTGVGSTNGGDNVVNIDANGKLSYRTLDSRAFGSTLVDGSGVSNYLSRWFDNNTLTIGTIYDNGTNVGIGTTNPTQKLSVSGNILISGTGLMTSIGTTNASITGTLTGATANLATIGSTNITSTGTITGSTANIASIGTTSLTASGTVKLTGLSSSTEPMLLSINTANGILSYQPISSFMATSVDGSGVSNYLSRWFDNNTLTIGTIYDNGTNVGIGTTNVSGAKLTVNGTVNATSFTDGTATLTSGTLTALSVGATNVNMTGTLDLGTNTIYDGFLTGNWNFSNGAITALSNVATTNATISGTLSGNIINGNTATISNIFALSIGATNITSTGTITGNTANIASVGTTSFTASGTVTLTGVGSTNGGDNVVNIDANGKLSYRTLDSRSFGSTLVDGSGVSNYLSRWLDENTLILGVVYDNGTNVGIGTTDVSGAKLTVNGIIKGTSLTDGTALLSGGSLTALSVGATSVTVSGTLTSAIANLAIIGSTNITSTGTITGNTANIAYVGTTSFTASGAVNLTGLSSSTEPYVLSINTATGSLSYQAISSIISTSVDGTGVSNYLSRWFDSNTLTIGSVYDNGTNVGVGTTDVSGAKLTVNGTAKATTLTDGTATLTSGTLTALSVGATNVNMSGTLDLGTNTIYDGFLTGNWNFSNGAITALSNVATTNATISGTLSGNIINGNTATISNIYAALVSSTNMTVTGTLTGATANLATIGSTNITSTGTITGSTANIASIGTTSFTASGTVNLTGLSSSTEPMLVSINTATGSLSYQSVSSIIATSVDGSGVSNYLSRWLDTNTLTIGVVYDNGTNVGIGTTDVSGARLTVDGIIKGTSLTDGTALLTGGSLTALSVGATNVTVTGTLTSAIANLATVGSTNITSTGTITGNTANIAYVGTTSFAASGTVNLTGVGSTNGGDNVVNIDANGKLSYRTLDSRTFGSTLVDGSGVSNYLSRWFDNNTLTTGAIYDNSTNVGIGTTDVSGAKLTVNGTIKATSLTDGTATLTSGALTALSVGATNINMSGTIDLGTNTIYDGFLTGNWNFSNGAITALSNIATTNATISGTLSGNIINGNTATISNIYALSVGSTNINSTGTITGATANLATIGSTNITSTGTITGSTSIMSYVGTTSFTASGAVNLTGLSSSTEPYILSINTATGSLSYQAISSIISTSVDGTGVSNYLSRWFDNNTLTIGSVYDNGTNVGIGTTDVSGAKLTVNGIAKATTLTDGTATLTSGTLTALSVGATNVNMSGTLDLGTNTIYDGFLTGNWNFSNGAITALSNVATTNATISGTLSGNIINGNTATISNIFALSIGATNITSTGTITGNTANIAYVGTTSFTASGAVNLTGLSSSTEPYVLSINTATGSLSYQAISSIISTSVDGTGVSNYLSRWFDSNTLTIGSVYDNGTNVGVGTTDVSGAKLTVNGTAKATTLTDGTATLTSGTLTALSVGATNVNMSGTLDLGTNTIYDGFLTGNWNFSNGAITALSNVATTNATISGTLSGNIINGNTATISNIYAALVSSTNMTVTGTLTGATANLATIGSTNITSTGTITGSTANIASIGTTALTASGTIKLTGLAASTEPFVLSINTASGTLSYQPISSVISTSVDGTGISNYLSRWLDVNTLTIGSVYDNGTNVGIGTTSLSAALTITPSTTSGIRLNASGTNPAEIRFSDSDNSNYTGFKAPNTLGQDIIYTLPSSTGMSNYVLTTDNAGTLSWQAVTGVGAGTVGGSGISNYNARWLDANTLTTGKIYDNGTNVGIGTTNPLYALSVVGDIYASANLRANTDIFVGGIGLGSTGTSNTTSGAYKIGTFDEFTYSNSTTVQGVLRDLDTQLGATIGGSLSGTGPANYLTKYSVSAGVLQASTVYDNGTNVGIGTTNPTEKLAIIGNVLISGTGLMASIGTTNASITGTLSGNIYTGNTATISNIYALSVGSTNITSTGTITGATANLATIGSTNITSTGTITGSTANIGSIGTTALTATGAVKLTGLSSSTEPFVVGINTSTGALTYESISSIFTNYNIVDGTGVSNYLSRWIDANTITAGTIYDNGTNIGLGTTAPAQKLSVVGNILVSGTGLMASIGTTNASITGTLTGNIYTGNTATISNIYALSIGSTNITSTGVITGSTANVSNIGTTTLSATGSVNFKGLTSGTNPFVLGIDTSTGTLYYQSIDSRILGTTLVDGSGVSNYLSRWLDNNTLTISSIYDSGTNVGIGTTNPLALFEINKNDASTGTQLELARLTRQTTGTATTNMGAYISSFLENSSGSLEEAGRIGFVTRNATSGPSYAGEFSVKVERETYGDMVEAMSVYADGGTKWICGNSSRDNGPDCFGYTIGSANIMNWQFDGYNRIQFDWASPVASINTLTGANLAFRTLNTGDYINFDQGNDGSDLFIATTGNLGIGTTTPAQKLSVVGNVLVSGTGLFNSVGTTNASITGTLAGNIFTGNTATISNIYALIVGATNITSTGTITGSTANIGSIGTTALTATGAVKLTGLSSSTEPFIVGINTSTGSLSYQPMSSIISNFALIDGSGVSNYLSKWVDASTLTIGTIYDNGTNIGLGTTAPAQKLSVVGNILVSGTGLMASIGTTNASITGTLSGNVYTGNTATISNIYALSVGSTNITSTGTLTGATANLATVGSTNITSTGTITGATANLATVGSTNITSTGTITGATANLATVGSTNITSTGTITGSTANIGSIGTTALTATGAVKLTGLSSSTEPFVVGINTSTGALTYESISSIFTNYNIVDGTGVSNYLSRWIDANTITAGTIYDNGTNIGLGTTAPAQKLSVVGNILVSGTGLMASIGTTNASITGTLTGNIYTGNTATISNIYALSVGATNITSTGTLTGATANLATVGSTNITSTGTITGATANLATVGSTNITSTGTITGSTANIGSIGTTSLTATGAVKLTGLSSSTEPFVVGINTSTGALTYEPISSIISGSSLIDGSGVSNYLSRWLDNNTLTIGTIYDNGTNVGIGTTNPTEKLSVIGNVLVSGTGLMASIGTTNASITGTLSGNIYTGNTATISNIYALSVGSTNITSTGTITGSTANIGSIGTTSLTATGAVKLTGLSSSTEPFVMGINTSTGALYYESIASILSNYNIVDGTGVSNYLSRWSDANTLTTGMVYDNGTNVGIGTTNPLYTLDLNGTLKANSAVSFTGLSSAPNNTIVGINTSTGTLSYETIDSRILGTSLVDGSGVSNYLSKWFDADTLINGTIYDNGTNIGLGTTAPAQKLSVVGNILVSGTGLMTNIGTTDASITGTLSGNIINGNTATISNIYALSIGSTNITSTGTITGATANLATVGSTNITSTGTITGNTATISSIGTTSFTASGIVNLTGIGSTDSGDNILNIDSNGKLSYRTADSRIWDSTLTDGSGISNYLSRWLDNNTLTTGTIYDNGTNVGIGTTTPLNRLDVNGGMVIGSYAGINTAPANGLLVSGNVGIGTTAVSTNKLTVSGGNIEIINAGFNINSYNTLLAQNYLQLYGTNGGRISSTSSGSITIGAGTAPYVYLSNNGNFGIGTTNPAEKLSVIGNALISGTGLMTSIGATNASITGTLTGSTANLATIGATSITATGTVKFSGVGSTDTGDNVLNIDGNGKLAYRTIDSRVWGTSLNDGTGVSNYLARWFDDNTLTNSSLYDNGTSFGIGTTTPSGKFEIQTSSTENKAGMVLGQNDTTNNPVALSITNLGTGNAIDVDSGEFILDSNGNITTTGTTGITLNVNADVTFGSIGLRDVGTTGTDSGAYMVGYYGTGAYYAVGNNVQDAIRQLDTQLNSVIGGGGFGDITGVGSMSTGDVFSSAAANGQWLGLGNAAGRIHFVDSSTDKISVLSAYLGIGTSNPLNTLDVLGSAVFGSSYAGVDTAPTNGLLVQGSFGLGTVSPKNKLDISGSAIIGSSYAGSITAPTNGLLVEGNFGVGTTSIPTGFEAFIKGDLGLGTGAYLNIGSTFGEAGYGIRDYNGVIQVKNASGSWLQMAGGGFWGIEGASAPTATVFIDQTLAYRLGIGTTAAQNRLDVSGSAVIGSSYAGTVAAGTNGLLVEGNLGVGTTNAQYKLDINGTSIHRDSAYFANGTTYYIDSTGNASFKNITANGIENPYTGSPDIKLGTNTYGSLRVGSATIFDDTTAYLKIDTNSDQTDEMKIYDNGNLSITGNMTVDGGELTLTPKSTASATNPGLLYFDSDLQHLFLYDSVGTGHRISMDMTKYSASSTSVAPSGYIEVTHNQNTNDLAAVGMVYNSVTGQWENIRDAASSTQYDSVLGSILNPEYNSKVKTSDVTINYQEDLGTGADGALSHSSGTYIYPNSTYKSAGFTCSDGGDMVNYNVTALTSTSATLELAAGTGCLKEGDEILLINLKGSSSAYDNVGNYETLRVASLSADRFTVYFTKAKSKYYGSAVGSDAGIGLAEGNQIVMLQRVPNYTNVTLSVTSSYMAPDDWVAPTGAANNGAGEGGVLFFRATGTVSIGTGAGIIANSRGFIAGVPNGYGGEAFCGKGGNAGVTGTCGGGGGAPYAGTAGNGSATGGAGGGGGTSNLSSTDSYGGGGAGGGYGTAGLKGAGALAAGNGGTNTSGIGGEDSGNQAGGGGGGGSYGTADLSKMFFGSAGGAGGAGRNGGSTYNGGAGGDGGGIVYIAANTINNAGSIYSIGGNGAVGSAASQVGGGGAGAGGSIKLVGNTLILGSGVSAAGGTGGSNTYSGGNGGNGIVAVQYTTSVSGSSTPSFTSTTRSYNPYAIYVSKEINTPNATAFGNLGWTETITSGTSNVVFQTRSGSSADSTDGTWESWKPLSSGTNFTSLNDANTHTDWTGNYTTVLDGDISRNTDYFEDEDETNTSNVTKFISSGFEKDTNGTLYTSLISYWPMNETSTNTAVAVTRYDSITTNSLTDNRTATSYTLSGTGKKGNAADLEATNGNFLEIVDNDSLSTNVGASSFTVAAWVNIESTGADRMILTKSESATVREYELYYNNTTSRFNFVLYNSGGTAICTAVANNLGAPSTATWYNVVGWYDSTAATCSIQVNNGTADSSSLTSGQSTANTTANFRVGARYTTEALFFDGLIDEVGFWKKALSAQERTDLYNSGNGNTFSSSSMYAETTNLGTTNLSSYDYISAWVYMTNVGSTSSNLIKLGIGESAGSEQFEDVIVDSANKWQKVYWDISDIASASRDAITKLRFTIISPGNTLYIDNVKAEKSLLTTPAGSTISSTPNNYIQYRAIMTTTNTLYTSSFTNVLVGYTNTSGTYTIDANSIRATNNLNYYSSTRVTTTETSLDNLRKINTEILPSGLNIKRSEDFGTGADGAISHTSGTLVRLNTSNLIAGRTCADGGDMVNYSVTDLTSTTATIESTPSSGCLSIGDEILLINLKGSSSAYDNVGNYETLRILSIAGNVITFTTSKSKYYGSAVGSDAGIGLAEGNQIVMLQRVPNYTNVTVSGSASYLYPDNWVSPTGVVNNGAGEGGVFFFRATGTVSIGTGAGIIANAQGFIAGVPNGYGGEAFCGKGGNAGVTGTCGGGGGAPYGSAPGSGSATGGAGGGGGNSNLSSVDSYGGGGAGGGYGTPGLKGAGALAGGNGGTNTSGIGGEDSGNHAGGGGGGGSYGTADLSKMFFGSAGGAGGAGRNGGSTYNGGAGGDGGGIVYIAANTISNSGIIQSVGANGAVGSAASQVGGGGAGAGGSIKLVGNTLILGSGGVSAAGGTGGSNTYSGGNGGDGIVAVQYVNSVSGSSTPSFNSAEYNANEYAIYTSDEISTAGAPQMDKISFTYDANKYGLVQLQTRTGKSNNSTDESWEEWRPVVGGTNIITLNNADTHTDWTGTNATVADGDVTREVDFFESEDESTAGNTTKFTNTSTSGYAEETISSTNLASVNLISMWVYSSVAGNSIKLGMGESAATENEQTFYITTANAWQKLYWDISDIDEISRDAITKLRVTGLSTTGQIVRFDNIQAESLITDTANQKITSSSNDYIQYRAILATVNRSYSPILYKVSMTWGSSTGGYSIVQPNANTVRLYNNTSDYHNLKLEVTVFGADLAEWYTVNDQSIESGDLVSLTGQLDQYGVPILAKTYGSSDAKIIGVISTKAGQTYGIEADDRRPMALSGRVPVKIDPSSENIFAGDSISASDIPGVGRKAKVGDKAIGTAMEDWKTGGKEKVMVLVATPYEVQETGATSVSEQIQTQVTRINDLLGIDANTTDSTSLLSGIKDTLKQITDTFNEFKQFVSTLGITMTKDENGKDVLTFNSDVSFLSKATFNDVTVTGDLNVGLMKIDSLNNSIDVIGAPCGDNKEICEAQTLYIQKNLSGNINMMNGKIMIMTNGDVEIAGTLKSNKVITNEYSVKGTSKTIGSEVLKAGTNEIIVYTDAIKQNSKVFITTNNSTKGQTPYIKERTDGVSFTIAIDESIMEDIKLDWFIVNQD